MEGRQCRDAASGLKPLLDRLDQLGHEVFDLLELSRFKGVEHVIGPIADAFGTWVEKKFAGKTYKGVERTSFIVGPDGRVEHVLPRVKPIEHVDLLMEHLAA